MALKGTLLDTLKEARPTVFFAVPRVWEKIMEGMKDKGRATTGLMKKVADACKAAALDYHLNDQAGIVYKLGKMVVFSKIRQALGLDRCRGMYSGAAPLAPETTKYFLSLDMIIYQAYGLSETSGAITGEFAPGKVTIGSVGPAVPGCQIKLKNEEICMTGRSMMMGYLNCEDKTKEAIDADGWFHSGDMGTVDTDGNFFITG